MCTSNSREQRTVAVHKARTTPTRCSVYRKDAARDDEAGCGLIEYILSVKICNDMIWTRRQHNYY